MGKTSKKCKLETESVTFNVLNPRELAMYEHVNQQTNKSGYFKHLVELDLMNALSYRPVMFDSISLGSSVQSSKHVIDLLDSWLDG